MLGGSRVKETEAQRDGIKIQVPQVTGKVWIIARSPVIPTEMPLFFL